MKAMPMRRSAYAFEQCEPSEATHLKLHMPGPIDTVILPVITKGRRAETNCWSWNGDVDKPTLKPSLKTTRGHWGGKEIVCHSFVNDGKVKFLNDSTHELAGKTVDLLDVE